MNFCWPLKVSSSYWPLLFHLTPKCRKLYCITETPVADMLRWIWLPTTQEVDPQLLLLAPFSTKDY